MPEGRVDHAAEQGGEHHLPIVGDQEVVGRLDLGLKIPGGADHQPHDGLGDRHEQRGRNAFAAHVADGDRDLAPAEIDDVVQIAADLARRYHVGEDIELFPGAAVRLHDRQHGALDGGCARHLGLVRALLRALRRHDAVGDDQAIADGGAERGERARQRLDQRHRER